MAEPLVIRIKEFPFQRLGLWNWGFLENFIKKILAYRKQEIPAESVSMPQEGTMQMVLIISTQTQAMIASCARHQAQIIYFIRIKINQTVSQLADKTSREWGQGKAMLFFMG